MSCKYIDGLKTMEIAEPSKLFGSPVPLSFTAIYERVRDIDPISKDKINNRNGEWIKLKIHEIKKFCREVYPNWMASGNHENTNTMSSWS